MRAYYFTPLEFGRLAVERQRLKISRVLELNDPYELLGAVMSDDALRSDYMSYRESIVETRGIISLGRHWSAPIMWSHYADRHRGVCLGFDVHDENIFEVEYSESRFEFSKETVRPENVHDVLVQLIGTKHAAWSYEEEVRIWCELGEPEGGLYFEEFDERFALREVIMGVRCSPDEIAEFADLVRTVSDVQLIEAALSNDAFEVIARSK